MSIQFNRWNTPQMKCTRVREQLLDPHPSGFISAAWNWPLTCRYIRGSKSPTGYYWLLETARLYHSTVWMGIGPILMESTVLSGTGFQPGGQNFPAPFNWTFHQQVLIKSRSTVQLVVYHQTFWIYQTIALLSKVWFSLLLSVAVNFLSVYFGIKWTIGSSGIYYIASSCNTCVYLSKFMSSV